MVLWPELVRTNRAVQVSQSFRAYLSGPRARSIIFREKACAKGRHMLILQHVFKFSKSN
jgi:hypothetical protein